MTEEDTFKTLREPSYRNCLNCKHFTYTTTVCPSVLPSVAKKVVCETLLHHNLDTVDTTGKDIVDLWEWNDVV